MFGIGLLGTVQQGGQGGDFGLQVLEDSRIFLGEDLEGGEGIPELLNEDK